ncbi:MAG: hypothetical protein ACRYFX_13720 [Janthinobacterium lividum]
MKKIIFLLTCLIWLAISCNQPEKVCSTSEFIAFDHTGAEEYHVPTFVISPSKLKLVYIDSTIYSGKRYSHGYAGIDSLQLDYMWLMLEYDYDTTDCTSYSLVRNFILSNPTFFTNKHNHNHGDYDDYCVFIGNSKHELFYKQTPDFFRELVSYLKQNHADKNLIKRIEDKSF